MVARLSGALCKALHCCWSAVILQVVGRKRAPNFTAEQRPLVYRAWQQYERAKASRRGWDRADLAAHLYRQLVGGGYRGVAFDAIYRDEVQDFTQAELCLDLRVCSNPNGMFYCGECGAVGTWGLSGCAASG